MPPLGVALWLANVAADTAGRIAFKSAAATGRWSRSPWTWLGILCFVLEFALWLALVSVIPLSQAILLSSINIVTVAVAGRWIFRERLDGLRAAAFLLIAGGVAVAGAA